MENLIELMKRIRVKFTGAEQENKAGLGGSRDHKIPVQRTQSLKEKKKTQNWFQRLFSRKLGHDSESKELDHAAAVAAAALAITSQEQTSDAPEIPLTRTKSKVDGTKSPISLPGRLSKRFSGSFKSTGAEGTKAQTSDEKKPEKALTPAPSFRKSETFGELLKSTDDEQPETPAPKTPPPVKARTKPGPPRPPTPPRPTPQRSSTIETKAVAWETTELKKIEQRYGKLKEVIDSWEDKKKKKARRKLDKKEGKLDLKRAKALEKFREANQYVDRIASGAREQAEESRRKDELKVKEKANAIRTTGQLPWTCGPCF